MGSKVVEIVTQGNISCLIPSHIFQKNTLSGCVSSKVVGEVGIVLFLASDSRRRTTAVHRSQEAFCRWLDYHHNKRCSWLVSPCHHSASQSTWSNILGNLVSCKGSPVCFQTLSLRKMQPSPMPRNFLHIFSKTIFAHMCPYITQHDFVHLIKQQEGSGISGTQSHISSTTVFFSKAWLGFRIVRHQPRKKPIFVFSFWGTP